MTTMTLLRIILSAQLLMIGILGSAITMTLAMVLPGEPPSGTTAYVVMCLVLARIGITVFADEFAIMKERQRAAKENP